MRNRFGEARQPVALNDTSHMFRAPSIESAQTKCPVPCVGACHSPLVVEGCSHNNFTIFVVPPTGTYILPRRMHSQSVMARPPRTRKSATLHASSVALCGKLGVRARTVSLWDSGLMTAVRT